MSSSQRWKRLMQYITDNPNFTNQELTAEIYAIKRYYKKEYGMDNKILELENKLSLLEDNLDFLREEFKSVKEQQKEPPKPKRWRAERGGGYFYLDSANVIQPYYDYGATDDDFRFNSRNYFRTEAEAEAKQELNEIEMELVQLIAEINDGWVADWEDKEETKYYLTIIRNTELHFAFAEVVKFMPEKFYCKRRFLACEIDKIGEERLIKYLRDV